jgi:hypothetical protein
MEKRLMTHITEIDDALSAALNSLAAAQAILRKSAPPRDLDIIRKADLAEPQPRDNIAKRALDALADLERRVADLKAADAARANADAIRKTAREASQ